MCSTLVSLVLVCHCMSIYSYEINSIDTPPTPPPADAIFTPMVFLGNSFSEEKNRFTDESERAIDVAVCGHDVYIRGISVVHPDGWLKGIISGDKLMFNPTRLYFNDTKKIYYFTPAIFERSVYHEPSYGNDCYRGTIWEWHAIAEPFVLEYVDDHYQDGPTIDVVKGGTGLFFADTKSDLYKTHSQAFKDYGEGWREWYGIDAFVGNIKIVGEKLEAGLDETQISDINYQDDTIYNLQGMKIDDNNLTPGIYIKRGKKFVVK